MRDATVLLLCIAQFCMSAWSITVVCTSYINNIISNRIKLLST